MTIDTANEGYSIKIVSGTVFEEIMGFVDRLKATKKKKVDKDEMLAFFEVIYTNKQTIDVKIENESVKFEGLNEEQVECFLKIFEGYKKSLEPSSVFGKVVRHEDFEEVKTEKSKVIQIPTPPLK